MEQTIRELLPEGSRKPFDDIVNQNVLGASRHIEMIGDMFESLVERGISKNDKTTQVIDEITKVAHYFISTRGEASQAVGNAIYMMIQGIENYRELEIEVAGKKIIEVKNSYKIQSNQAIAKCVEYGTKLARKMKHIFVYDYSSTVEKLLRSLDSDENKYTIYIAESRIIDGGKPYVKVCQEAGHSIKFLPEASMMYDLKQCDGVFMGAETFYPDGTGFNTTGSDIVGLICKHYQIPLYFITPMIKLDTRPVYGGEKNLVYQNLKDKLSKEWDIPCRWEQIDFVTPELVGVEPQFIKAFITEKGVIPSSQMYQVSMEYSRQLKGR